MLLRTPVTMRVAIVFAPLLVACGPTVASDDDGGSTTDASTTMPATSVGTLTSATTASTTVSTAMSSDEVTSVDPTTSDVDDGPDSDGSTFIPPPDPDSGCFDVCIECDQWAQDCAENEKCMPWANDGGNAWNSTKCSPVDPEPATIGETCTVEGSGVSGIDYCEFAAMCWGVDPLTLEGVCVPICTGSPANPACPDGLECMIAFDGNLLVCLPPCDPLAPTCAADEVCTHHANVDPTDAPFVCQPIPPFEPQAYGLPCNQLQLCDDGLACVAGAHVPDCADRRCCTLLGDVAAPPVCPDVTQTCIPFDPDAMEGLCFCGMPA